MHPFEVDTWLLLGEVKAKAGEQAGAQECLQGALDMCGPHKAILRNLSMVMRVSCPPEERAEQVAASLELARQAVQLDLQDGYSWYVLANAYCSSFFANRKKMDLLQLSLKAYHFAEKKLAKPNPDLFFNRA